MKRRAQITIETERLLVISRSGRIETLWCDECGAEVSMLRGEEAAAIAGLSQRQIFHLAEAGEIHFKETIEGLALFCVNSLSARKQLAEGD